MARRGEIRLIIQQFTVATGAYLDGRACSVIMFADEKSKISLAADHHPGAGDCRLSTGLFPHGPWSAWEDRMVYGRSAHDHSAGSTVPRQEIVAAGHA
jgi:hypothetical protein